VEFADDCFGHLFPEIDKQATQKLDKVRWGLGS
jgi:hypothetical protein